MGQSTEKIKFVTKDGVTIVGDHYAPLYKSEKGVLLLHMMPAVRGSFAQFAEKLAAEGYHALAIDLRGHGESTKRVKEGVETILDYKMFTDVDHQKSIEDVRTAIMWLHEKGINRVALVGASIGANLALEALQDDHSLQGAILLSAGYNYRGLETLSFAKAVTFGQGVYYVASHDDGSAAEMSEGLFAATDKTRSKKIKLFESAGHGTTIFENNPLFVDECIAWLKEILK